LIAAAGLAAAVACGPAPRARPVVGGPVTDGPESLAAARKYLQGRWVLESFEVRPPARAPITLKGTGLLDYDDFGNMRMEIRTDQAASDLLRAAGIEIRDGVISTDGRTAVDMQNRTLTYIVAGQPVAGGGPLAMNRPRHWEVTADVLTLTTRDDGGAPVSVSRWKRSR
jgi:hypothetical protein